MATWLPYFYERGKMEDRTSFPGERFTWLYRQTPGVRNAKYPWVIQQNNNGATVKLSEEQMAGIVQVYLDSKEQSAEDL
jgi:hypothetical protein